MTAAARRTSAVRGNTALRAAPPARRAVATSCIRGRGRARATRARLDLSRVEAQFSTKLPVRTVRRAHQGTSARMARASKRRALPVSTVSLLFVFGQGLLVIESYVHSVHNYSPHTHSLTLRPNPEHHLAPTFNIFLHTFSAGKYASGSATACLVCGADHLYSAGGSAASRCDLCRPGSFTAGGTATNRHTCEKCAAGYTCDGTSDTSTQCSAGTFAAKGSFYCTPCGNDNMFSGVGAGVCAVCGPGSFTGGGSSTTRQTCAACTAGSKCSGTSAQVKCDVGTFSTAGQNACADCGVDNLYSGTPGTADACVTCAAGSVTSGGNPTTRTTCETCTPGYKCVGTSSIVTCGAGFFSAAGSSACAKCADGTKYSQPAAAACSTCAIGSFTSGGDKDTRTNCEPCPAGHTCSGSGIQTICPAGKFSGAGSAVCSPCGDGKKFSSAGAGACSVCSPGFRTTGGADDTTRTQCDLCDAGSACDGSSTPTFCAKGKYAPGGSSSCLAVR